MTSGGWREISPESGAIEICVEVSRSSDFDTSDAFDFAKPIGDLLRDHARSFFQALGQLEADGGGGFAHFDFGRAIKNDIHGNGVVLLDVTYQGFAKAICERQIHSSSCEKEN